MAEKQEKIRAGSTKESIIMAFNLGVWVKQEKGHTDNILEIIKELRDMIYWNMSKQYGDVHPELLNVNVEYFLEIALLGYVLPGVCLPDEELKNRLLALIEAKAGEETLYPLTEQRSATSFNY